MRTFQLLTLAACLSLLSPAYADIVKAEVTITIQRNGFVSAVYTDNVIPMSQNLGSFDATSSHPTPYGGMKFSIPGIFEEVPGLVEFTDPGCGGCVTDVLILGLGVETLFSNNQPGLFSNMTVPDWDAFVDSLPFIPGQSTPYYLVTIVPKTLGPDGTFQATYTAHNIMAEVGSSVFPYPFTLNGLYDYDQIREMNYVIVNTPEPSTVTLTCSVLIGFLSLLRRRTRGAIRIALPRMRSAILPAQCSETLSACFRTP